VRGFRHNVATRTHENAIAKLAQRQIREQNTRRIERKAQQ
jgi:hypothetical protein